MRLKKISTSDKSDFEFVQKVYIESFPPDERRPLLEFQNLMDKEADFTVCIIESNDQRVGFLTYWDFNTFIFAEHFAVSSEFRNGGYGREIIGLFVKTVKLPVLLEVELPDCEMSKRRVKFYERAGFKGWDIPFEQPPYEAKYSPIPMMLMTHGDIDMENDFSTIKKTIYTKVYNVTEV